MSALAYGVVAWLVLAGVYGVVTSRNLIHMVVCLSVAQSATDIFILEIGYRSGGLARWPATARAPLTGSEVRQLGSWPGPHGGCRPRPGHPVS